MEMILRIHVYMDSDSDSGICIVCVVLVQTQTHLRLCTSKGRKNQTQIPKLLLHTIYPLFMLQNMYEQTYLYIYKFGVEA